MAWICDKNGNHRCEIKKLTYNGTFMEVSSITVTVESPAPIAFAIGDYIDWDYDGLRYTLDTAAGVEKQATRNSVGNAFIYENLVFLSPLKAAENADFFDVILDNTNDFLTNTEFSFYGTAWNYAKRLEANLCRVYGSGTWKVRIWTSGTCYDETPATGLDTGAWENKLVDVAGIKCLGGFQQIYDLWGCAYVFSVVSGVNYVDFYDDFEQYAKAWQAGGVDKIFAYGKGNGLYKIRHTPDADHVLVTRLRPYGSGDNLPPNYYLNSEDYHVDGNESSELAISHLMLPASQWTKDGVKHPANAFLEQNTDLYGVREGVVLWDGSDPELGEIKPSIYGLTIQDLLNLMASGDSYRPDEAKWPDTTQRIDKIITGAAPTDNGVKNEAGYDFTEVESSGSLAAHSFGTGGAYIDVEFNDLVMGTTPSVSHLAEFRIVPTSENKVAASFDVQASVASAIRAVNAYLTPYVGGVKISDATYPCTVTEEAISNTVEGITYTKRYKISLLDSTGNPFVFSSMYTGNVTFRIVAHIDFIGNPTGFPVVRNEYAVSFNLLRGNKAIDEYFSVTIPQIGFDLSAAVANGAKLCMRSGANQPREFQIIPSSVRYLPDTDTWFVRCKRSVDQSISTYFPNSNSVIAAGDEYYFTGIVMPPLYVEIAAQKLLTAATAWLALHSKPRMLSAVDVDNKIMAVEEIVLKEGMSLPLSDTDLGITPQNQESRVIDNIRIEEGSDPIRTFTITLRDKKEKSSLDAAIRGATSNFATNASVSEAVNAATGTGHGSLTGRDMPNQHPISAITGLEEALLSSGFFEYDPVSGVVKLKSDYDYLGPKKGLVFDAYAVGATVPDFVDLCVKTVQSGNTTQRVLYSNLPLITKGDQIVENGTPGGGGGGGGVSYLHELLDVYGNPGDVQRADGTARQNGDLLGYNSSLDKWVAIAQSAIAPDLSDYYTKSQTDSAIATAITALGLGAAATYDVASSVTQNDSTHLVTGAAVYSAINTAISSAIKFQGITTTALTDGSTTNPITIDGQSFTAQRGDEVIYGGKEFLWTGSKWQQLGDEESWANKTITISAGTGLTGGGNLESNRTISLSQDSIDKLGLAASALQSSNIKTLTIQLDGTTVGSAYNPIGSANHTVNIAKSSLSSLLSDTFHPYGGSTTLATFKIGGATITWHAASGNTPGYLEIDSALTTQGDQIVVSGTPGGGGGGAGWLYELGDVYGTTAVLRADGTEKQVGDVLQYYDSTKGWVAVASTAIGITTDATQSAHGLMSAADKTKLDYVGFGTAGSDYVPIYLGGSTPTNVLTAHQSLSAYATIASLGSMAYASTVDYVAKSGGTMSGNLTVNGQTKLQCGYFASTNPSLGYLDSGTFVINATDSVGGRTGYGLYIWDDYTDGTAKLQSGYENTSTNPLGIALNPLGGNVAIGYSGDVRSLTHRFTVYGGAKIYYTSSDTPLELISESQKGCYIGFNNGSQLGWLGYDSGGTAKAYIGNTPYTIWHSGNLSLSSLAGSSAVGSSSLPVYYTGSALATVSSINVSGLVVGGGLGVNKDSGDGTYGLSLYRTNYHRYYGMWFGLTSVGGTYGGCTGAWATYLTSGPYGWIFQSDNNTYENVASISSAGQLTLASGVTAGGNLTFTATSCIEQLGRYNIPSSTINTFAKLRNNADRVISYNNNSYGLAEAFSGQSGNYYIQVGNWDGSAYYNILLNPFGGNVGIGTNAPAYKLEVVGGRVRILNPNDPGSNPPDILHLMHYEPAPYGIIVRGYSSGVHSIQVQREANDSERFGLSLNPLGGGVIIGSSSAPSYTLDVRGTIRSTSTASFGNNIIQTAESSGAAVWNGWYSYSGTQMGYVGLASGNDNTVYLMSATSAGLKIGTNSTTAIYVDTSQNVGIGTTQPTYKFQVQGGDAYISGDTHLMGRTQLRCAYFYNSNPTLGYLNVGTLTLNATNSEGGTCGFGMYFWVDYWSGRASIQSGYQSGSDSSSPLPLALQPLGGTVGIGLGTASASYTLQVAGVIASSGDQVITSDETKKKNLVPITLTAEQIANAPAISFDWKDGHGHSFGSIAQYWKPLVPEAVLGKEGDYTLAYGQLGVVLGINNGKAIFKLEQHETEQDKEIRELKEALGRANEKIEGLEKEVKRLRIN